MSRFAVITVKVSFWWYNTKTVCVKACRAEITADERTTVGALQTPVDVDVSWGPSLGLFGSKVFGTSHLSG